MQNNAVDVSIPMGQWNLVFANFILKLQCCIQIVIM